MYMVLYVYILQSEIDGKYYIGETVDVAARLDFHNAWLQRSTRHHIPFRLLLVEEYPGRIEALHREKQIKSWEGGRAFKILTGAIPNGERRTKRQIR